MLSKNRKNHGTPLSAIRNRFKLGEDPDKRMDNFLRGRGEFSPESSMKFDKEMEQVRMEKPIRGA